MHKFSKHQPYTHLKFISLTYKTYMCKINSLNQIYVNRKLISLNPHYIFLVNPLQQYTKMIFSYKRITIQKQVTENT